MSTSGLCETIWWHVYPLGFGGAPIRDFDPSKFSPDGGAQGLRRLIMVYRTRAVDDESKFFDITIDLDAMTYIVKNPDQSVAWQNR